MGDVLQRVPCNNCGDWTLHERLSEHRSELPLFDDETGEPFAEIVEKWAVFKCCGCGDLTLRTVEDFPWEPGEVVTYLPERQKTKRKKKIYQKLPETLTRLYEEVVDAFNRGSLLLCAAGLRALIEGVCADQGIREGMDESGHSGRTLAVRINGLKSVVPMGIVGHLHGFRFLGNRALHELDAPSKEDLDLALSVVEDVLNVVYDLNYRAERLFKAASRSNPGAPDDHKEHE